MTSGAKYSSYRLEPVFAAAEPYAATNEQLCMAARFLSDKAGIILLDCMGYTEDKRKIVETVSGLPVILAHALMSKLLSEMI
jgi:protein AroM